MVRRLTLCLLLWAWTLAPVQAATYYISPSGSDGNSGTSSGAPWKTWSKAMGSSGCGDTVMAMDGSYTVSANGSLIVTKTCSSGSIWTVQAVNERQAWINNDNTNFPLRTLNASYIAFIGLHISTVDRSGTGFSTVQFRSSNHITFKRNLVQFNNRYGNTHMVELYGASDCLIEENEVYDFHRHGIIVEGGSRNIIRRNYVNARSRNAIPDGYNGTSGDNGSGDDAFILYPGDNSILENNIADGQFSKAFAVEAVGAATNNKWIGNINNGGDKGQEFDARGSSTAQMPNDNYVENFLSINPASGLFGPGSGREGFYSRAARGITCKNCTIMGAPSYGFLAADNNGSQIGDGNYGLTLINTLAMNATSGGYSIPGTIDSWSGTNVNAYNNSGAAYNPSSSSNWISKFTTDPQMGTCKVYRPDGSAAKANNWGADILYRYQNGVLTNVPLWNTVTGEFPHGAIVSGVNDIAGSSVTDIHIRLNVNANGCAFPAGYTGGSPPPPPPPDNPTNYTSAEGTTFTSHLINVPVGTDSLEVCVAGWLTGGGSIGSISAVTSSGEALTKVDHIVSPNGFRFVDLWTKLTPSPGLRTINVAGIGSLSGLLTVAMYHENVQSYNQYSSNVGSGQILTVSTPTASDETIVNCIASGKDYTFTSGPDDIIKLQKSHSTQALRLIETEQAGVAGGVVGGTNSDNTEWAMIAQSLSPDASIPPAGYTLTLSKYRWEHRGPEAAPYLTVGTNAPVTLSPGGSLRLRMEISAGGATTPTSTFALYCQVDNGGYQRITDLAGASGIKLHGSDFDGGIPSSGTSTTQLLSVGNFAPGYVCNDENCLPAVNAMTVGQHTEMVWNLDAAVAAAGQVVNCVPRLDNGTPLTNEGAAPLPTATVTGPAMNSGF